MLKYISKSFTDKEDKYSINYSVLGNPATIFLLDEKESFIKEQMSKIAIEENSPMSCFIKKIKDNNFDIFFFNLDGSQAYMCGHGTLATACILNKIYNLKEINFFYDTSKFKNKNINNLINVTVNDGLAMIKMDMFHYSKIDKKDYNEDILKCRDLLGLLETDVNEIICGKEYYDLTFVLNDSIKLRKLQPNFKELAKILAEDKMDVRNLCVTAKSIENNFDFETRVFCPHDNLNEDIACGSSNLTISRYWHDITNKDNFKILFPYNIGIKKDVVGGIQFINIKDNKIFIGGYCK